MSIVLARVDGRMIHGQVANAWCRLLNVDEIVVINDEARNDEMQATLLEFAVPPGVDFHLKSVAEAADLLKGSQLKGSKTMLIFKELQDAKGIMDAGFKLKELNIGGMYYQEGKTQKDKALYLSHQDELDLRTILELGTKIFYQVAPMNDAKEIQKYL